MTVKGYKPGLKEIFDSNRVSYKDLYIKDGHNNQEIWEYFDLLFQNISENDQIYVDVTHSFRSTPFIIMAVLNYAKFVKNVEIKGIYYGAYIKGVSIIQVVDLSIFNTITDWTIAAEKLITLGESRKIGSLIQKTIDPVLKETKGNNETAKVTEDIVIDLNNFSNALYTVRGQEVSVCGVKLKESLALLKEIKINELKPFGEILDKVSSIVEEFNGELVHDVTLAIKSCIKFNLIQQAYTFLEENIINYVCEAIDGNITHHKRRALICQALNYLHNREIARKNNEEPKPSEAAVVELANTILKKIDANTVGGLAKLLRDVSNKRNDINHAGYRTDEIKVSRAHRFIEKLEKYVSEFEEIAVKKDKTQKQMKKL